MFNSKDPESPSGIKDQTPSLSRLADDDVDEFELVLDSLELTDGAPAAVKHAWTSLPSAWTHQHHPIETFAANTHDTAVLSGTLQPLLATAFQVPSAKVNGVKVEFKTGDGGGSDTGRLYVTFPTTGWTAAEKQKVRDAANWFFNTFRGFKKATVHPLFDSLKVDLASFDAKGNKRDFTGQQFSLGPAGQQRTYYQPMEAQQWQRFGLKVLGKFSDDNWLADPSSRPRDAWWRVFHGTNTAGVQGIISSAGTDGALHPSGSWAALDSGVYTTPHVEYALNYSQTVRLHGPDGVIRRNVLMFQCAAKPGTLKREGLSYSHKGWLGQGWRDYCESRYKPGEYSEWTFEPDNVRPYGVLLANAEVLEDLFKMQRGEMDHRGRGATDIALDSKLCDVMWHNELTKRVYDVWDVHEADITLENLLQILQDVPATKAVRLHGEKHIQDMLGTVASVFC